MYMEGQGGGSNHESYQNVLYFFARHTSIDCFEKRGRKGYLFIVGDELPYDEVNAREVETLFGDTIQANIPVKDIVAECAQKYEIYYVIPSNTSHGGDHSLFRYWETLLGAGHVIRIQDANLICDAVSRVVNGGGVAPTTESPNVRL
jgi:hypothetical protein